MKIREIKTTGILILMIAFIYLALTAIDYVQSQLFAAGGIIIGMLAAQNLTIEKPNNNEQ